MKIQLTYQLAAGGDPIRSDVTPEEFFDPLDHGETYWDNGVQRYVFLHEHLGIEPEKLKWVVARLTAGEGIRIQRAQYLDGDNVTLQHTVDEDQEEELIVSTALPDDQWNVVRLLKSPGDTWKMTLNDLVRDPAEGMPSGSDLCKGWTFEERKAFSFPE